MPVKKNKKRQIRRCTICGKIGHNRSTCSVKIEISKTNSKSAYLKNTSKPISVSKPVKFFIHHLGSDPLLSPHLVDLKNNNQTAWGKAKSYSAENSSSSLYHYYHNLEQKTPQNINTESLMVNLNNFSNVLKEKTIPIATLKKEKEPDILPKFFLNKNKKKNSFKPHFKNPLPDLNAKIQASAEKIINNFKIVEWKKVTVSFAVIATLLIVPSQVKTQYSQIKLLTTEVGDSSSEGFMSLQDATSALMQSDLLQAQSSLTNALQKFNNATEIMNNHHKLLQKIIKVVPILNDQVTSRQNLILAGQSISLGNAYLLKGYEQDSANSSTNKIGTALTYLQLALPHYNKSLSYLNDINTNVLPFEYQAPFNEYKQIFESLISDLQEVSKLANAFQEIFGEQGMRRYLLVFQNENEIRATGGFIGSFAILDVKNGKIENLNIPAGGSYDLQGQLTEFVEPPAPLLAVNKRWEFQDANWFPNFPDTAEKLLWFFRKSRNLTADGVIAINSSVLGRLLTLTGPIIDEKRDLELTSLNALTNIQTIVETGQEKKDNKPKQILSDLAPVLLSYLENIKADETLPLLSNLNDALNKKEIQVYFKDETSQEAMSNFGWAGKIIETNNDQDYLMVVNSNIQGQKTDANIKQEIYHESLIQADGRIINNVIIKREHTGNDGEQLYGQTNIDYIRLYVPQGSTLLSAEGFNWPDEEYFKSPENWYSKDDDLGRLEKLIQTDPNSGTRVTSEFGKTAFGNWIITEPGKTSEIRFSYELPFKINLEPSTKIDKFLSTFSNPELSAKYQLIVQKQSGNDTSFLSQIIFPGNWQPTWSQGNDMTLAINGAKIQTSKLKKDEIFSILMQKK